MTNEFALNPYTYMLPTEEDKAAYEDANNSYRIYDEWTEATLSLIEETVEEADQHGHEGFFGNIADFFAMIVRVTKRFIEDTAGWLAKKIKSLISFRKRQKKLRDAKFQQWKQLWNSMSPERRSIAIQKFQQKRLNNSPSFEVYLKMCQSFAILIHGIDQATKTYISQDVQIFGQQRNDNKKVPNWITEIYDEKPTREALVLFGVRFEDNKFQYRSPFLEMPSMSLADLGYMTPEALVQVDNVYQHNCWGKMYIIVALKETFERFKRQMEDKSRELKKDVDKLNKKDLSSGCKLIALSVSMAGKLTAIITQVEEALDTRRGWLIDAALHACADTEPASY